MKKTIAKLMRRPDYFMGIMTGCLGVGLPLSVLGTAENFMDVGCVMTIVIVALGAFAGMHIALFITWAVMKSLSESPEKAKEMFPDWTPDA